MFSYNLFIVALSVINIVGFIIVGVDKHKARKKQWRIQESMFFVVAALGGCLGVYAGLMIFRHKTKHWYFMVGIPLIFIMQIIAVYFLVKNL